MILSTQFSTLKLEGFFLNISTPVMLVMEVTFLLVLFPSEESSLL
jgi:hypothetical protein